MPPENDVTDDHRAAEAALGRVGVLGLRWVGATVEIAAGFALVGLLFDAMKLDGLFSPDPGVRLRWIVIAGAVGAVFRLLNQRGPSPGPRTVD